MKVRRFLKIVVPILLILAATFWWLTTVHIPPRLKVLICKTLEQRLDRRVTISDIKYNLFKGIVLKDLTIFEMDQTKDFLKIKEASFTISSSPLLRKKIFIPSLRIYQTTVNLVLNESGEWNFSDILDRLKERSNPKDGFSIVVSRVTIRKGEISFEDQVRSPKFSGRLTNLNGDLRFSVPDAIKFNLSGKLFDRPTTFTTHGRYRFAKRDLSLTVSSKDLILTDYSTYYQGFLPFQVEGGTSEVAVEYLLEEDVVKLSVVSAIEDIDLKRANLQSRGDLQTNFDITYKLARRVDLKYKGDLILKEIEIMGMPAVETIFHINGNVKFSEERIWTETLKGVTLGCPIMVTGDIENFKNPSLDLNMESDIDLAKLKACLPDQLEKRLRDIEARGKVLVVVSLSGELRDPSKLTVCGQTTFQGVEAKTPLFAEELKNITGEISFTKDSASSHELLLTYKDTGYRLTGSLKNFARPDCELKLTSKDLSIMSNFSLRNGQINISKAEGSYLNSSFSLGGKVKNFKDPALDLHGDLLVDLADLRKTMPAISKNLKDFALEGKCDLQGVIRGRLKEPKGWDANLRASSRRVSVKEFEFEKVLCDLRMKNRRLSIARLVTYPYGGRLTSSFACDLARPGAPFMVDLEIMGLDLARLAEATPLIEKDIWGRLSGKLRLEGLIENTKTFRGNGWVKIVEANLWEIKLLGQLGDLLYFTTLPTARLSQAYGTFVIADEAIGTKDLELGGDEVTLLVEGSVGFDAELNLYLTARVAEKLAAKLPDKVGTFFKRMVWGGLARYRIEGTISDPKFSRTPINEILIDELKVFFEKLFK